MRQLMAACAAAIVTAGGLANPATAEPGVHLGAGIRFVQHHDPYHGGHLHFGDSYHFDWQYGPGYDHYYYPPYYPPFHGPYVISPLVIPSETIYGPGVMRRFMGLDPWGVPPAVAPVNPPVGAAVNPPVAGGAQANPQPAPVPPPDDPPAEREPSRRSTNERAQALAQTFVGYGDVHFRAQKYRDAYSRYRKAIAAAPQLADGHFRYAFALVALGRYEDAAEELKRGLALDPNWPQSGFRLGDLYGDNQVAKNAHLESIAQAAEADRQNGDLLLLVGAYLFFDGHRDRAAPILQHAAELAPGDAEHLRGFGGL